MCILKRITIYFDVVDILMFMKYGAVCVILIPCIITTSLGSEVLPLRFRATQSSTSRVSFMCSFQDIRTGAKEIKIWYKPGYPTDDIITLYRWTSDKGRGHIYDPLTQERIKVSLSERLIVLSINHPVHHDSGIYHCEVTLNTGKGHVSSVIFQITKKAVESVHCETSEATFGKTGIIFCYYKPIHSTPSIVIWKKRNSGKMIYSYSFLHARGQGNSLFTWLNDRLSHGLDIREGKISLKIANTNLLDTGTYEVEVKSMSKSVRVEVLYSVKVSNALTLTASSMTHGGITFTGVYPYNAFSVLRIEWFSLECGLETLLVFHDALKNTTSNLRSHIIDVSFHGAGRFYLTIQSARNSPLFLRCKLTTSQGPLQTDLSIQYFDGMEQLVKPIVNRWPELVKGEDANALCRRMCSVLPDISSPYVKKNIGKWIEDSDWDAIWVSAGNVSVVSIGKINTSSTCSVIQQNHLTPREESCKLKTHLMCINLQYREEVQERKHRKLPSGVAEESSNSVYVFPAVGVVMFVTVVVIAVILRWALNKIEYFRRPWELSKNRTYYDTTNEEEQPLIKTRCTTGQVSPEGDSDYSSWGFDFKGINERTVHMLKQFEGNRPVVVGIMSSGFDMNHPVFAHPLPEPRHHIVFKINRGTDRFGQGTFLAGVIIEQCKQVCSSVQLINLQAVSRDGKITTNAVQSCFEFCLEDSNRPDILLIPNCFTHVLSPRLGHLLARLMVKTAVIISASNDVTPPKDMRHLGDLAKLIIGSHDKGNNRCKESPDYWGVDFLAPGNCVKSAMAGSVQYVEGSGTVVAAAWVCGILVHVILQGRCIEKTYGLSAEYTTWMMHNVLLAMSDSKMRTRGDGYGFVTPEKVLLDETELRQCIRASSV